MAQDPELCSKICCERKNRYCEIIPICGVQFFVSCQNFLIRGDVILWVTGFLCNDEGQFIS